MFEYEKNIRDEFGEVYTVRVSKVGGGTVGRSYPYGDWDVEIYAPGGEIEFKSDGKLYVGMPKTHEDVAYIAMDLYINGGL